MEESFNRSTWMYKWSVCVYFSVVMPPFREGEAYCFAHVCRSVSHNLCNLLLEKNWLDRLQTWYTDTQQCSQMIPIAQQVSGLRSRSLWTLLPLGVLVFHKHVLLKRVLTQIRECTSETSTCTSPLAVVCRTRCPELHDCVHRKLCR